MSLISRQRSSPVQSLLSVVLQCLVLSTFASLCAPLLAQTIAIKLVNGKDGRPVAGGYVNVWVGGNQQMAMAIPTNREGIAHLRLSSNGEEANSQNTVKGSRETVMANPVARYADFIRVNVGYVLCQAGGSNYSWLARRQFLTKELVLQGIATPNTCGKAVASPIPGELVIFVRPLNFWERLKE